MIFASAVSDFFGSIPVQIALTILGAMAVQLIVRTTIDRVVRRVVRSNRYQSGLEEKKREDTLIHVFRTAIALVVWVVAAIVMLGEVHVNIVTLLTGAGLIGVIAGFGAQNAIKDYVAGLYIILENQYRVGDIVTLGNVGSATGSSGVVEEITLRITKLRDMDGSLHIVPNGTATVITNLTYQYSKVVVSVGVSYKADIDAVERVINEVGVAMTKDDLWANVITEPIQFLRVDSFGEAAVNVIAVGKVKPSRQWDVAGDFRRRLKVVFEKEGIEIPLPQRIVHQAKR